MHAGQRNSAVEIDIVYITIDVVHLTLVCVFMFLRSFNCFFFYILYSWQLCVGSPLDFIEYFCQVILYCKVSVINVYVSYTVLSLIIFSNIIRVMIM